MKTILKILAISAALFVLILFSCGGKRKTDISVIEEPKNIETIKFDPEHAIDFPFDSLFSSSKVVELQVPHDGKFRGLSSLVQLDSFLIGEDMQSYCVFNLKGKLLKEIGSIGEGPGSNKSLFFKYFDKEFIISICGTKWIKYGMNGSVIGKGRIPYEIYPNSFILLNDSTWLLYNPRLRIDSDPLRLWTTDKNFKIKKRYLYFGPGFPTGQMGFPKYIYQTANGIYITDRVVDTIYKFSENKVEPVYVFNYGVYKYYRTLELRDLQPDEVVSGSKIVTANAVLSKIYLNKKQYFIYHNRITNTTRTIKTLVGGPDLISSWDINSTDKYDRLYWKLRPGKDTIVNSVAIKFGYADFLKKRKLPSYKSDPIIMITTLR